MLMPLLVHVIITNLDHATFQTTICIIIVYKVV